MSERSARQKARRLLSRQLTKLVNVRPRALHAFCEPLETRWLMAIVRPDHIVVVIEEDRGSLAVGASNMPYFNQLATTGLYYNNSHGIGRPSRPNYLALFSGSTQGVTDNDTQYTPFTTANLGKSLNSNAGTSFVGYSESLPSDGSLTWMAPDSTVDPDNHPDVYWRAYNPMAHFSDFGPKTMAQVNRTFAAFPTDFTQLPTVSFIIPDMFHNTHGSNEAPYTSNSSGYTQLRANADTWLQQKLGTYVTWAKTHNSLLILTQDEEDVAHSATNITTIISGDTALFVPGTNNTSFNHYNVLRTIEDMYGLAPLGNSASVSGLTLNAAGQLAATTSSAGTTTTALTTSQATTVFGQPVTFTATVTSPSGTPAGTVSFLDGGLSIGTGTLNGSGVATLTVSNLSVATHSITASYAGNGTYQPSTSSALSQKVNKASTTTTLSAFTTRVFGESVTFSATVAGVSPSNAVVAGTVQFSIDGVNFGSAVTLVNGVGTSNATTTLSVGNHTIKATFAATTNYTTSNTGNVTQTVAQASTTVAVGSNANPSAPGQSVTFTATVAAAAPGSGIPAGNIQFILDGANFGSAVALVNGVATSAATTTLAGGNHTVSAVYAGNTNYLTSTAPNLTQTVITIGTTTALGSSTNPSVFGQSVTFTATVTQASGSTIPGGSVTFLDGATSLGTGTLNASGVATLAIGSLSVASHSITAVYAGAGAFTGSTSSAVSQVVNKSATTTTVNSSLAPSAFGQSITFSAAVAVAAPGAGTPTGTVQFLIDGVNFGSPVTLVAGSATSGATSALTVGAHTITAVYAGSTSFLTSTSSNFSQTINPAATTTTLGSSNNPSVTGQSITLTATVAATAGSAIPTGTVNFFDGATNIGTGTLNGSGIATMSTSSLSVASHSLTAVYVGTSNFTTSTSSAVNQVVNKAATTTTIAATTATVFGQSVSFSATVAASSPGSGSPTGTVQFIVDGVNFGSPVALISGSATSNATSSLSVGSHTLSVSYAGSASYATSTSSAGSQTVNAASTTTAVNSSQAPSSFGQSITFTATVAAVAPGSGTPSGTVQFLIDGVNFGSPVALVAGLATSGATSSLAVGSHSVTAVFAGSASFLTSTSSSLSQNVTAVGTTTSLTSTANPSAFGQGITLTATVAAASGSATPSGSVTFMDGATTIGTGTLNGAGVATMTTSTLSVASHSITAVYAGTTSFTTSTSSALSQAVNAAATTTTLAALSPAAFGQSVTFSATVAATAPGAGTPSGTVQFLIDGVNFGSPVTLAGGSATSGAIASLAVGSHTISAVYAGTGNFVTSTSTNANQTINAASTATAISATTAAAFGQSVTFTATVSATAPGAGTPTGTVQFLIDGVNFGSPVALVAGSATSSATSSLAVGGHAITAVYSGSSSFVTSTSGSTNQTINAASTTTVAGSTLSSSSFGQSVSFTATVAAVAPGSGTPTGTVQFLIDGVNFGSPVALVAGAATSGAISTLAAGNHSVTIAYSGGSGFNSSTSSALTQQVAAAQTTTALVSSANPSVFGQGVTLTATVSATNGFATPTGTVNFFDGATPIGSGTLDGGGIAAISLASLSPGGHSITAVFAGSGNFVTSTSSAVSQTVNAAATSAAVVSSQPASAFGQAVTFTATVSATAPGAGTPHGTVQFLIDGVNFGSPVTLVNGSATSGANSLLAVGSHLITATYIGTAHFATSTSSAITQNVAPAGTTTSLVSSAAPSVFGQSVTLTATVAVTAGSATPAGSVTFFDGDTSLGSVALDGSGVATFTSAAFAVGPHSITVVYAGGTNFVGSASSALSQSVAAAATTTTIAAPASSVFGQSVSFTATIQSNAPGAGTPTGTVQFLIDGVNFGSPVTLVAGSATSGAISSLTVGGHAITAVYAGATSFAGSTSSAVTQSVAAASTTTTLSGASPTVFGQSVTFTAIVQPISPGVGTATGTVNFLDGLTVIGSGTLDVDGHATLTTSLLDVGAHSITAVYAGATGFAGSTSAAGNQMVSPAGTAASIAATAATAFGQSVSFTATVAASAPGAGTPTGTVQFLIDGVDFGAPVALVNGSATSGSIASLAVGGHTISATYSGSSQFAFSAAADVTQQVNSAGSSTALISSAAPSAFGQSITFTATVNATAPGAGIPAGTVQFIVDGVNFGSPVALVNGSATSGPAGLTTGSHTVVAVYSGSANFATSSSTTLSQTVAPVSTTTTVVSSANPSVFGQGVTLTATVAVAIGSTTPAGTVNFFDGLTQIGTGTLDSAGQATLSLASLAVGSHSITVVYEGAPDFAGSTSAALSQVTNAAGTTTTVAALSSTVFGQSVSFTATVASITPGSGTPSGSVQFLIDGVNFGSPVALVDGSASSGAIASLSAGDHVITAVYAASTDFATSTSSAATQHVSQAGTSVTIGSSANPAIEGQPITLTASVSTTALGAGVPDGSVQFIVDGNNFGSPVALVNGSAATIATLASGEHSISVVFLGSTNFSGSTSIALTQTVAPIATTTTLTASINPSVFGQGVTYTATVTPAQGSAAPTGLVTFMDGTTVIGTGTLDAFGVATLTASLPAGVHSITAVYGAVTGFAGSTSAALSQTVTASGTTASLPSSAPSAPFGSALTFTATIAPVAPGAGVPTGTVQFVIDGVDFGAPVALVNGVATSSAINSLSAGSHTVVAIYSGDTNFATSTSTTVAQVILPPPPMAPTGVDATDGVFGDRITVTWIAAPSADGYEIWRSSARKPGTAVKIGDTTSTSFDDTTAQVGTEYWYWIVAKNAGGASELSLEDNGTLADHVIIPTPPANPRTTTRPPALTPITPTEPLIPVAPLGPITSTTPVITLTPTVTTTTTIPTTPSVTATPVVTKTPVTTTPVAPTPTPVIVTPVTVTPAVTKTPMITQTPVVTKTPIVPTKPVVPVVPVKPKSTAKPVTPPKPTKPATPVKPPVVVKKPTPAKPSPKLQVVDHAKKQSDDKKKH